MQSPAAADCRKLSLVKPIGYQPGDCGYCKKDDSSGSYYITSKSLCPEHYQILVDRGWRRSGSILYLPDVTRSCCPHYTIRLPVADFKPSRDQRQALNRWNRFILGDEYEKELNKKYPKSKADKKKANNTFDLLQTLHSAESHSLPSDLKPAHTFTVTLEPDTFTEEKYALFANYQSHVHHETPSEITPSGFRRFLCSSPLSQTPPSTPKPLGSYHQLYRLDNRLIALAVLDLLPHAVSGVYFIYHSDFETHSLGKISALREAGLALEGGYEFYYMGYYIHSCKKMRYKGDYKPQYVLDLGDMRWNLFDEGLRGRMDEGGYASPSKEGGGGGGGEGEEMKPEEVMRSGRSLIDVRMPGVMTADQVEEEIDLDTIKISLGRDGMVHQMQDLVGWDQGSINDARSIKRIIAELAACIGPEAAEEVVVDFSR